MLSRTTQLNEDQLKELEELKAICKKKDGSAPNLYTHLLIQKRNLPTVLRYQDKQQLVGFLSVFSFMRMQLKFHCLFIQIIVGKVLPKKCFAIFYPW